MIACASQVFLWCINSTRAEETFELVVVWLWKNGFVNSYLTYCLVRCSCCFTLHVRCGINVHSHKSYGPWGVYRYVFIHVDTHVQLFHIRMWKPKVMFMKVDMDVCLIGCFQNSLCVCSTNSSGWRQRMASNIMDVVFPPCSNCCCVYCSRLLYYKRDTSLVSCHNVYVLVP